MAAFDPKDLKNISLDDLSAELEGAEREIAQLEFDHATRGIDNPLQLRILRRNIAQMRTELRAREIAGMSEAELSRRSKIRKRRAQ